MLNVSKTSQGNQKIFKFQEKWGCQQTKRYIQKVPFYDEDYVYQASELLPLLSINKAVYVEDTFCYMDYVSQTSKLQHM